MEKIKIIIIDDHKIVRAGIKALLFGNPKIEFIAEGSNDTQLIEILNKKIPDLIIMDISLPGLSGIELTEWITQKYPSVKILILTSNNDEESIISAIEAGANGFLHKDSSEKELINAIEYIYNGEGYFSENISKIIYKSYISKIQDNQKQKNTTNKIISEREVEIIKLFADGLSYKEIADKLCISTKTVESHKVNILNKLELKNTIDLVKYAIKNKLIQI